MEFNASKSPLALIFNPIEGFKVEEQRVPSSCWERFCQRMSDAIGRAIKSLIIIAKNLLGGAVAGVVVGGAVGTAAKYVKTAVSVYKTAKVGGGIGGALGFVNGVQTAMDYQLSLKVLSLAGKEVSTKSGNILKAFLEQSEITFQDQALNHDIICPISNDIYVFPVDLACSHSFEFSHIITWLEKQDNCPSCRHSPAFANDGMQLSIKISVVTQKKVLSAAEQIFGQLEKMLGYCAIPASENFSNLRQNLRSAASMSIEPLEVTGVRNRTMQVIRSGQQAFSALHSAWNNAINSSEESLILAASKEVIKAGSLLDANEDEIIQSIIKKTLSPAETYSLSLYFIERFRPIRNKIDEVYIEAAAALGTANLNGRISDADHLRLIQELKTWRTGYRDSVIPKKFKMLRELSETNGHALVRLIAKYINPRHYWV
jgi:hypothetical protein